jgi:hypothetical protein
MVDSGAFRVAGLDNAGLEEDEKQMTLSATRNQSFACRPSLPTYFELFKVEACRLLGEHRTTAST